MSVISEKYDILNTQLESVKLHFDPIDQALWVSMHPRGVPCFSESLLHEIRQLQIIGQGTGGKVLKDGTLHPMRYVVLNSAVKGIYNLGGDLNLFLRLIQAGDRDALLSYAKLSVQVVWETTRNYGLPLTTIALVKGLALGGGMESAIACSVVVAERSAEMALPEVLFNLFPGMGAYSVLSRKIGATRAEKLILSGKTYSAAELYEMGVVDILAEDGEGEVAVHEYIKKHTRQGEASRAMQKVRERVNPITYDELNDIVEIWVDTALRLSARDQKVMNWVIAAQIERLRQSGTPVENTIAPMALSA